MRRGASHRVDANGLVVTPMLPVRQPRQVCRICSLSRGARGIIELAREFEPSASAIRQWVKPAARDEGLRGNGLTTAEREELNRLRRENRVPREEREIAAKAAGRFAKTPGARTP